MQIKTSMASTGLFLALTSTAAHSVVIDFELGQYFDGTTLSAPRQLPNSVFSPDQYYLEDGIRHSAIPFNSPGGASHIHGNTFQNNRRSQVEGDAGGAFFESDSVGQFFSFNSWGQQFFNDNVTVQGQDSTGAFSVILDPHNFVFDINNTIHAVDFLSLNSRFANVNRVEYWFTDSGRGELPPNFDSVTFVDNVNISAVPVPPALLLFGSGLLSLIIRKRKVTD